MTLAEVYRQWGLAPGASARDVRARFRQLVLRVHPDMNPGDRRAQDTFIALLKSHDLLLRDARLRDDPVARHDPPVRPVSRRDADEPAEGALVVPLVLSFREATHGVEVAFLAPAGSVTIALPAGVEDGEVVWRRVPAPDGAVRLAFRVEIFAHAETYRRWELSPDSSQEAIRQRFRDMALFAHPALSSGDALADERFERLVREQQVLLDYAHARRPLEAVSDSSAEPAPGRSSGRRERVRTSKHVPLAISFEESALGTSASFKSRDGRVEVRLEPGVEDGHVVTRYVRLGGREVEVSFVAKVWPHRRYRRRGNDILVRIAISPDEAWRGCTKTVKSPWGLERVPVERHSRRGDIVRLPGKGMPSPAGRGDLYVELADREDAVGNLRG